MLCSCSSFSFKAIRCLIFHFHVLMLILLLSFQSVECFQIIHCVKLFTPSFLSNSFSCFGVIKCLSHMYILFQVAQWLLMVVWFAQLILNVFMSCRVCSCEVAEEKRKPDKSLRVAQRRSRLATPIGTPGGRHTPGGFSQPQMVSMPAPAQTREPYYPSDATKEPYYPSKTPPDQSLPPYRVTPPRQETPPPPPPPQMEEPSPPPMSELKAKQVYRRNTSDSQI